MPPFIFISQGNHETFYGWKDGRTNEWLALVLLMLTVKMMNDCSGSCGNYGCIWSLQYPQNFFTINELKTSLSFSIIFHPMLVLFPSLLLLLHGILWFHKNLHSIFFNLISFLYIFSFFGSILSSKVIIMIWEKERKEKRKKKKETKKLKILKAWLKCWALNILRLVFYYFLILSNFIHQGEILFLKEIKGTRILQTRDWPTHGLSD